MADLQLHAAVALIVLQPVHELDLLQVLVVDLLPLGGQGLIACTVLLQVGHHLVPLLCDALSLLVLLFKLKPGENRGETLIKVQKHFIFTYCFFKSSPVSKKKGQG